MKCRWCDWEAPEFYTTKEGKKRSGWSRLQNHIEENHEEQARELAQQSGVDEVDLVGEFT